MDFSKIGKVDAFVLLVFINFFLEGSFEKSLEQTFNCFAFNRPAFLLKEEFFYFLDALFRSISKLIVQTDTEGKIQESKNWRINSKDLGEFVNQIFGIEDQLVKFDFISNFLEAESEISNFLIKIKDKVNEELKIGRKNSKTNAKENV